MKYLGWVVSVCLIILFFFTYKTKYIPLQKELEKLEREISMWETVLKGEKGLIGDRNRLTTERFFEDDELTPYGEVEILRKFDTSHQGLELYISAPRAFKRSKDVLRFLADQRVTFRNLTCYVVIDSTERFEYKFIK